VQSKQDFESKSKLNARLRLDWAQNAAKTKFVTALKSLSRKRCPTMVNIDHQSSFSQPANKEGGHRPIKESTTRSMDTTHVFNCSGGELAAPDLHRSVCKTAQKRGGSHELKGNARLLGDAKENRRRLHFST